MKTSFKLFALGMILAGFGVNANAQVGTTATAEASATIVTPIAINKNVDLAFGNVAVNNLAGTVVLATDASRTVSGGVTVPASTGTVTAAQFTVTGVAGYAYTFTVPTTATTVSYLTNTMTVDAFTHSSTGVLTSGTEVVKVGARLNVGATQPAGVYTSATPFTVTVNYN
jgi:hypothetical protein